MSSGDVYHPVNNPHMRPSCQPSSTTLFGTQGAKICQERNKNVTKDERISFSFPQPTKLHLNNHREDKLLGRERGREWKWKESISISELWMRNALGYDIITHTYIHAEHNNVAYIAPLTIIYQI